MILVEQKELQGKEIPNYSVNLSEHLREQLPDLFYHESIMYYRAWELGEGFILFEQGNAEEGPHLLSSIFDLQIDPRFSRRSLEGRARKYAINLQRRLLTDFGLASEIFFKKNNELTKIRDEIR